MRLQIPRRPSLLTACNCSACRRYGSIWSYHLRRSVRIDGDSLASYRRPAHAGLDFHHCRVCGCVTHWESIARRRDGGHRVGVNARNIEETEIIATVPIQMLDGAVTWTILGTALDPDLWRSPAGRPM
jgi:hypothetical protein